MKAPKQELEALWLEASRLYYEGSRMRALGDALLAYAHHLGGGGELTPGQFVSDRCVHFDQRTRDTLVSAIADQLTLAAFREGRPGLVIG